MHYDVITLGAGGAASELAHYLNRRGKRVAMVERDRLGGLCLNYGCDPTKSLLESARVAHLARQAERFGIVVPSVAVDMPAVIASKARVLERMSGGGDIVQRLRATGIDYYQGEGRFVEPLAIEVDGRVLRASEIVIATGTRAAVPPIQGLEVVGFITNVEAVSLEQLPQRLAVIGGGPVGLEFAQLFARLGSRVTLIEAEDHIAPAEDPEIAEVIGAALEGEGVEILQGATIERVHRDERGKILTLRAMGVHPRQMIDMPLFDRERQMIAEGIASGGRRQLAVDEILVAVGRTPNTDGLNLEVPGVRSHQRGIVVDDYLATTAPHVWAVGDVTGHYQFTHMADYQARALGRTLGDNEPTPIRYQAVPWCIFTDPEIAHVGVTYKQARAERGDVHATVYETDELPRSLTLRAGRGRLKLVTTTAGAILGASICAPEAGTMLAPFVLAIRHGLTVYDLAAAVLPYPTMGEAVRWACQQAARELSEGPSSALLR